MHNDSKLKDMKWRYELLRSAGFSANESNRYKYWRTDRVHDIIARKRRCDKLLVMLDYNYDQAWQMAGSYTDDDINELIKNSL